MNRYKAIIATDATIPITGDKEFFCEQMLIRPGMTLPEKIPFIDAHETKPVIAVTLGRAENLRVEHMLGDQGQDLYAVVGDLYFSEQAPGATARKEVDAGNVWGLSVRYQPTFTDRIPTTEARVIDGETIPGGQVLVRGFTLQEVSLCVIPKDLNCKIIIEENQQ